MRVGKRLLALLFFVPGLALAHEYWIALEHYPPALAQAVKVVLGGGHSFPQSDIALSDRVLQETYLFTPDGKKLTYPSVEEKGRRVGEITLALEGEYLLSFSVQRPGQSEPQYCAKAIIVAGKGGKGKLSYQTGCILEIVPESEISSLRVGGELRLKVLYQGQPIRGTLQVSIEGKKNFFVQTDSQGMARLALSRPGRYLMTVSHQSKGSSLSFYLGE